MSGGARSNGVSAGAQAQIEDLTTQVLLIHVAFGNFYLSLFFGHFRLSWMAVKPRHLLRKASLATCNSQWVKKGKKSLSPKICQALQIARQLSCCPLCFRKIPKELTSSPPGPRDEAHGGRTGEGKRFLLWSVWKEANTRKLHLSFKQIDTFDIITSQAN